MRRRSRTRRVLKWVGIAACVLMVVAYVVSARWTVSWNKVTADGTLYEVGILGGRFFCWRFQNLLSGPERAHAAAHRRYSDMGWKPGWYWSPTLQQLWIPVWIPLLLVALPTSFLWYLDRHRAATHETIHDWAVWVHRRRSKSVTWRLTTVLGFLHALAAVVAVKALLAAPDLLFPLRPGAASSLRELRDGWIVACLVWTTPIWAMLWARVCVRVMNSAMLDAFLGRYIGHCQHCGYDLTGNVSGRCPECGESVKQEAGR